MTRDGDALRARINEKSWVEWLDALEDAMGRWNDLDPRPETIGELKSEAPKIAFDLLFAFGALGRPPSDALVSWMARYWLETERERTPG